MSLNLNQEFRTLFSVWMQELPISRSDSHSAFIQEVFCHLNCRLSWFCKWSQLRQDTDMQISSAYRENLTVDSSLVGSGSIKTLNRVVLIMLASGTPLLSLCRLLSPRRVGTKFLDCEDMPRANVKDVLEYSGQLNLGAQRSGSPCQMLVVRSGKLPTVKCPLARSCST